MEPSTYRINSLVDKCVNGEFLLPEIQRSFVWKQTQVRDLIDSLYHEYPTGSILAWEAENPPRTRAIGGGVPKPNTHVELLILDGQQRLTALVWVFGNIINGKRINVYFNIEKEEFEVRRYPSGKFPWVSVTDVLTKGAVTTAQEVGVITHPQVSLYLSRLNRLERIKEYTYQVYILRKLPYQQVTDIFQRVNSKGTRLQQSELAIAELAFALPGFISDDIQEFVLEMQEQHYYFRLPFILRCVQAVLAVNLNRIPRADFIVFQSQIQDLRNSNADYEETLRTTWQATRNAIRRLVNILKNSLGIHSSSWIVSENALVVPVLYLAHRDVHSPDTKAMVTWLLYALMWRRYSGAAETALDQDFQDLLQKATPSFKKLLENPNLKRPVREEDLRRAGSQGPFRLMLYLASRHQRAVDWSKDLVTISFTGIGDNSLQFHHIFPTKFLKSQNSYAPKMANQLANLTFISRVSNLAISDSNPSTYLPELRKRYPRVFESHFIPLDSKLWSVDKFHLFLKQRRFLIAKGINEFMDNISL